MSLKGNRRSRHSGASWTTLVVALRAWHRLHAAQNRRTERRRRRIACRAGSTDLLGLPLARIGQRRGKGTHGVSSPCHANGFVSAKLQAETPLDIGRLLQGCTLTRHLDLRSLSCGHSCPLTPYRRRITIRRQSGGGPLHLMGIRTKMADAGQTLSGRAEPGIRRQGSPEILPVRHQQAGTIKDFPDCAGAGFRPYRHRANCRRFAQRWPARTVSNHFRIPGFERRASGTRQQSPSHQPVLSAWESDRSRPIRPLSSRLRRPSVAVSAPS